MSATGEAQITSSSSMEGEDVFTDDQRGDGKKKKFKPFQKMKNFFRGGSKKRKADEGDAPPMFRSTGALHHKRGEGEEDDDGGFRRKGLAGSRSISEDSVFQPETKEPTIAVLKGQAASMEAINTGFQAELYSKLKSRQSDSDLDEGLPYSPVPVVSPTTYMFRSRSKSESTPEGTMQQDSQRSLISFDGSDEDLFSSNWKSGVASVKTRGSSGSDRAEKEMEVSDFEEVQMRSTHLSNDAAKHRISVKPKSRRLSSKMSMKRKEKPNMTALADVKEELPAVKDSQPVKQTNEPATDAKPVSSLPQKTPISTTIPIGSPAKPGTNVIPTRTEPRDIPQPRRTADESQVNMARSLSPVSTSPVSKAALEEVKLKARPLSGKFEGVELRREPLQSENELSKAFNRAKRFSRKYDEDGNIVDNSGMSTSQKQTEVKKETEVAKAAVIPKEDVKPTSVQAGKELPALTSATATVSSKAQTATSPVSPGGSAVSFVLKKEPLRPSNKTPDKHSSIQETTNPASSDSVAKDSNNKVKDTESVKKDNVTVSGVKSDSSMSVGKIGSPEKLASPREDYLLKRHSRSKTLPVSKELVNTKDEIGGSPKSTTRSGSPPLRNKTDYDNVSVTSNSVQSKRASWAPESASGTASVEPAWMRNRLKKMEPDNQNKEVKIDVKRDSITEVKTNISLSEKTDNKSEKDAKVTGEKQPVTSNIKSIIEKNSSGPAVRSWGQSPSVKSVEKATVVSSTKPGDKVTTGQTETVKNVVGRTVASPTKTSQNTNVKSTAPVDFKPMVSSAKAVSSSSGNKPLSQSVKPTVSSVSKPVADKPLSQSVRSSPMDSKFSQFGGKVGSTVQPLSQSVKVTTQPTSRPAGGTSANVQRTDSKESIKSQSSTDTKKNFSQGNKKPEADTKQASKQTSAFEKPKSASTETPSGKVPAWRQALSQRKNNSNPISQQVKIEIIDKEPTKPTEKRVEQKPTNEIREKPKVAPEKCSDGNRTSKVLDMVKSFQKLQVT